MRRSLSLLLFFLWFIFSVNALTEAVNREELERKGTETNRIIKEENHETRAVENYPLLQYGQEEKEEGLLTTNHTSKEEHNIEDVKDLFEVHLRAFESDGTRLLEKIEEVGQKFGNAKNNKGLNRIKKEVSEIIRMFNLTTTDWKWIAQEMRQKEKELDHLIEAVVEEKLKNQEQATVLSEEKKNIQLLQENLNSTRQELGYMKDKLDKQAKDIKEWETKVLYFIIGPF